HYRVFRQELRARGLPLPLVGFGLTMIGPILLVEGTDEQKREHLPRIVRGELRWCQGYSEPGAGSDLANLRMRAVRDGEEFVVDGQKVWTSHAEHADWIFCLVRTRDEGRKQAGITFLLADMRSPGIRVRPIRLISGASPFCEVFFDGVRVPVSQVVGQIDDGWRVAKALLGHERSMVGESVAAGGARLPALHTYELREHALEVHGLGPDGRLADPLLRDGIIRSEMDQAGMRDLVDQVNEVLEAGGQPGPESSILKLVGTELNQRRWELSVRIAGPEGLGWQGEAYGERNLALTRQWLRSRGNSIEGGTSEVQRNIMARRVLGLPKGG
ncbi:MAG: acyl-CoA dehydrogenase family protein, partial [Myxococcota bacterium]|nr:acyl-CoA dehydrogenase family protein [Myxococcota bacterium]